MELGRVESIYGSVEAELYSDSFWLRLLYMG